LVLFTEFNFQPFIHEALSELKFVEATAAQERIIPLIKQGKNVVGESHTGTGKTHAFLLPLIDKIDATDQVQVVITAPSRELARQLFKASEQLVARSNPKIWVVNLVGGTDKLRQIKRLKNRQPQVVIGTPFRLLALLEERALFIHKAQSFVIDEADITLDMGFLAEVDKIATSLPKKVQFLVFSATIPEKLKPFLKKYLENPIIEKIKSNSVLAPNIDNLLISTKGRNPNDLIYQLLTIGKPYLAIIFANTKVRVEEISSFLKQQGLKVATIHGDIPPRERRRVMKQIQNLKYQYLVATDLAARGIDIEGVSQVINAEVPKNLDFFVHRVGRTGRANLTGEAFTLYEPGCESAINQLEEMGIEFKPKEIKNGEIIDSFDRNRRLKRVKSRDVLDNEMIGLIKKKRKKIKPGYKKKIVQAIEETNKKKRKIAKRAEEQSRKKSRKQTF